MLAFAIGFDSAWIGLVQRAGHKPQELQYLGCEKTFLWLPEDKSHQGLQSGIADKVSERSGAFCFLPRSAGIIRGPSFYISGHGSGSQFRCAEPRAV
jgi:hypothetical protein